MLDNCILAANGRLPIAPKPSHNLQIFSLFVISQFAEVQFCLHIQMLRILFNQIQTTLV